MKPASRFLILLLFVLCGCTPEQDVKRIRLAHALDKSHTVHQAMEFMAKRLEEKSGGKLLLEIYPGGQLGSEREALELLQIGSLGMTKVSGAVMESFAGPYRVFGVPYLFGDRDRRFRILDSEVGRDILESGREQRLLGLTYYDSGSRHFYTSFPVEEPKDLSGKKIRVMNSQSAIAMVDGLGAAATPLPLGDLYTALQQGVVDGAENNLPSFELLRHYETCGHLVLDGHTSVPDVLVMGTPVFDSLSEQEQRWVLEAAHESSLHQRGLWQEAEAASLSRIKKAGVKVSQPDASAFAQFGRELQAMFRKEVSLAGWIDRVEAIR